MYVDENNFRHYTNDYSSDDSSKESIPYRLEHVFDIGKDSYVLNNDNCCYFTPVYDISSDESIVRVEDGFVVAENQGTCKLSITNGENEFNSKPLLISVYKGNLPVTRKKSVFLKECFCLGMGDYIILKAVGFEIIYERF